jgi:hypothetical protein
MSFSSQKVGVANACAPVSNPSQQQSAEKTRVWSLTRMTSGMLGEASLTLAGIRYQHKNEAGAFQSQTIYPVAGDIQYDPQIARRLRSFEFRVGVTGSKEIGLVYRMLPAPGSDPNSWLMSAETVMQAQVGTWGYVSTDKEAGVYQFHRLNIQQPAPAIFPDINELADELLAAYVIDTLDHPVLQQILGLVAANPPASPATPVGTDSSRDDEEGEIYD